MPVYKESLFALLRKSKLFKFKSAPDTLRKVCEFLSANFGFLINVEYILQNLN